MSVIDVTNFYEPYSDNAVLVRRYLDATIRKTRHKLIVLKVKIMYSLESRKQGVLLFFHIRTVHLGIIKVLFIYLPTDALVSCLKNNIKIYIDIYI